jgi:hypothetical protein
VPTRKRAGKIALDARATLLALALDMSQGQQRVMVGYMNRWLDNGHNLDAADLEWLAAIASANNPRAAE